MATNSGISQESQKSWKSTLKTTVQIAMKQITLKKKQVTWIEIAKTFFHLK